MQLRRTLIVVLALLGALTMPVHADAVPGITPVGTLERFSQEAIDAFGPDFAGGTGFNQFIGGTLLPVLGARQLWQIYPSNSGTRTGVLVRDADTHRVIGSFAIQAGLDRAGFTFGGEWLHATDGGRRVFLATSSRRLLEVDTTTFAVQDRGELNVVVPLVGPLIVAGLTYDPSTGDLLVLYG